LFTEAGNPLSYRADGLIDTGHEPFHSSRSGRCVFIDPVTGFWWCRACRKGGDAVTLVRLLRGCGYADAAAQLATRFGPPPGMRPPGDVLRRLVFEAAIP
jgi:hypothetical protein